MSKIWTFFENMNELVYVADMDTYEFIYMNKRALESFGFHSAEEVLGKKCYEVLQHNSKPCAICTNQELKPGYFKEWRYYNPVLGKHFLLKDCMAEEDGRRCRIEFAMDISAQEAQNSAARKYHDLEKLVNEALRIALQAPTPDESVNILLEYLGKALRGERTYIFEKNETGGDDNTYEWTAHGVPPQKDNLQNVHPDVCANWYRMFSENKHIVIDDIEDIREKDPLQYEVLKPQNIRSLVVVPLHDDGKVIAFYGVDNPPRAYVEYASHMLQIMGHFITSTLKRRNLVRQLQEMSCLDQLTRFGNRHALKECIAGMRHGESVGVIYCDVTALKQVNDTEGHKAGDRLILHACDCLRKVLGDHSLFRIGGDEFLVLCMRIGEKELAERVESLKTVLREDSVILAMGVSWSPDGAGNMDKLLTASENLMYKDKSIYYKTLGIDRRRK